MSDAVSSRRSARSAGLTAPATSDRGRFPLAVLVAVPALLAALLLALAVGGLVGMPGGPVLTVLAALPLAGLVLAGVRLLNASGPGLVGAPLGERHEPGVLAVIADAAALVRVPAPREVVVDGSALIRVAPADGGGDLAVGLPLLLQLAPGDFRAVLARELAQRSDAGPPAARAVRRLGERLDDALATGGGPAARILARYRQLHASVAVDAVRQARRAADERAEAAVGRAELARATERLIAVGLAWRILVEEYLPTAAPATVRPRLAEGMRELLTHGAPELLATARLPGNPQPLEQLDPVAGVLENPATPNRIEAAILRDDRPAGSWQQVSAEIGARRTARTAARLAGVVPTGGSEPTLAAVLAGLEREDRPQGPDGLAAGLDALARHALICQGLARFTTGWDGPDRLERRDRQGGWVPWDGDAVVRPAAAEPAEVEQLRSWLIATGADLELLLTRDAPLASSAAGPVQVTGRHGNRVADLLVFADGVLLAPSSGAELADVVRTVGDAPRQVRDGRWIGVGEVLAAAVRERRHGLELQLRFADGSAVAASSLEGSALRGDPVQDLRRLLAPPAAGTG